MTHTDEPVLAPNARNPRTLPQRLRTYTTLWIIAFVIFAIDQFTKLLVWLNIPYPTPPTSPKAIPVIENFFYIAHIGNTGAAWSLLENRSILLALIALATLAIIYCFRFSLSLHKKPVQVTFGLICGGILGNLTDRLVHSHVIDFLDFHFGSYIYPTFNVADSAICCGAVLYFIQTLLDKNNEAKEKSPPKKPAPPRPTSN